MSAVMVLVGGWGANVGGGNVVGGAGGGGGEYGGGSFGTIGDEIAAFLNICGCFDE